MPDSELAPIENGFRMRKQAADSCRELLKAARAALASDKSKGDRRATKTNRIGLCSAYRNIAEDTAAWNKSFGQYYIETQAERESSPGGAHGKKAVQIMAIQMILYKAAPGYSNHSNGVAVDFNMFLGKKELRASKAQRREWRGTWLHDWLCEHAAEFGFVPLSTEEWHWDYK